MENLLKSVKGDQDVERRRDKEIEEQERVSLMCQLYCIARRCAEIKRRKRRSLRSHGESQKRELWRFWLDRSLEERANIMSIAEPAVVEVLSLLATRTSAHERLDRTARPTLQVLKRKQRPREERAPRLRQRGRWRENVAVLAAARFTREVVPAERSEYWHCRNLNELLTVNDKLVAQTLILKQPGKQNEKMISVSLRLLQNSAEMLEAFETLSLGGFLRRESNPTCSVEIDPAWQTPPWCERMLDVTLGSLLVGLFEQRLLTAYNISKREGPLQFPTSGLARPRMNLLRYLFSRKQESKTGSGSTCKPLDNPMCMLTAKVYVRAIRQWRRAEDFYEFLLTSQIRRLCHDSDVVELVHFWTSRSEAGRPEPLATTSLMLATLLTFGTFQGFHGIGKSFCLQRSLLSSSCPAVKSEETSDHSEVVLGCVDALSGSPLSFCGTVIGSACLQVSSKMQNDVSSWQAAELVKSELLFEDDPCTKTERHGGVDPSSVAAASCRAPIEGDEGKKAKKSARRRRKSRKGKGKSRDSLAEERLSSLKASPDDATSQPVAGKSVDIVPTLQQDQGKKRHSTGRIRLGRVAQISDTDSDEARNFDNNLASLRTQDSVASSEDDEDLSRLVASVGLHVPDSLSRGQRRGQSKSGMSLRLSRPGNSVLAPREAHSFAVEDCVVSRDDGSEDNITEERGLFCAEHWTPVGEAESAVQLACEEELDDFENEDPASARNRSPGKNRARTNSEGDTVSDYLIMDFGEEGSLDGKLDPNANLLNAMDLSTKRNAGGSAKKLPPPSIPTNPERGVKQTYPSASLSEVTLDVIEGSKATSASLAVSSSSGTDSPASEKEVHQEQFDTPRQRGVADPELSSIGRDVPGNGPSQAASNLAILQNDACPEPPTPEPERAHTSSGTTTKTLLISTEVDRMKDLAEDNALLLDMCLRLEAEASSLRNIVAVHEGHLATAALSQYQPRQIGLNYPVIPEHFVATFPSAPGPPQSPQRPSMTAVAAAPPPPPPTMNVGVNPILLGWSPGFGPTLPPAVGALFFQNRALSDCGKAGDTLSDDLNPLVPGPQDGEHAESTAPGMSNTPDRSPPSLKPPRESQHPKAISPGGKEVRNSLLRSRLAADIALFVAYVSDEQRKNASASTISIENCRTVVRTLWPRAQIKAYGSYISQLHLPSSDVDLVITLPKVRTQFLAPTPGALESGNAIREGEHNILARSLMHEKWVDKSSIKVISHTPIPLVKLCALIDCTASCAHSERPPSPGVSGRPAQLAATSFGAGNELQNVVESVPPMAFPLYDRCTPLPRTAMQLNLDGYPLRKPSRNHQLQLAAARQAGKGTSSKQGEQVPIGSDDAGQAKDTVGAESPPTERLPQSRANLSRRSMSALDLDTEKPAGHTANRRASTPTSKTDEQASARTTGLNSVNSVKGTSTHESFAEIVKSTTVHKRRASGTYYSTNHAPSYRGLREAGLSSGAPRTSHNEQGSESVAPECTPKDNELGHGRLIPVRLDISFESQQHFGVRANGYMLHLTEALPPLRPLVLILKQFCKEKGLSASYTGGISSYALTLLVARYLQETIGRSGGDLGALLLGFLDFYGTRFDPRTTGVSVGRAMYFSRIQANQYISQLNLYDPIIIEDPLCTTNNVGRNCFRIQQVLKTWRGAAEALHARLDQDIDTLDDDQRIGPLENMSVLSCMIKGVVIVHDD